MRFDPRTRVRGQASGSNQVINWLAQPLVRSVQRGTITLMNTELTHDATITSVLLQNSVLYWLGDTNTLGSGSASNADAMAYLSFVDATTIRATRASNGNSMTSGFQVVEYSPGVLKSNQVGTITTTSTATATINAVDPAKAQLFWLGTNTTDIGAIGVPGIHTRLALTNATTVTATCGGALDIVSFQIIEFN